jgi:hypothetical protein
MQHNTITTATPTFPTINGVSNLYGSTKYWAQETGVNEVDANGIANSNSCIY